MDCGANRTKMKLYLVDFGKEANGGRYALLKAKNILSAFVNADAVGIPEKIARLKMPNDYLFYIEVNEPKNPYSGPKFNELNWRSIEDV